VVPELFLIATRCAEWRAGAGMRVGLEGCRLLFLLWLVIAQRMHHSPPGVVTTLAVAGPNLRCPPKLPRVLHGLFVPMVIAAPATSRSFDVTFPSSLSNSLR
jgi:hypothetical protein